MSREIHAFIHSLSMDEMMKLERLKYKAFTAALNGSLSWQVEMKNAIDAFIDEKLENIAAAMAEHDNFYDNL